MSRGTHPTPTIATTSTAPEWSRPLRVIHLLLAIAVTAQLFIGSLMRSPHPGRPDSLGFISHEVIGGCILVLIVLHWAWSVMHPNEGILHLFPWNPAGMRRVAGQLRQAVLEQHLPSGGPADPGLAGFVHGLGLLAISAMVVIGGTFFVTRAASASPATLGLIKDIHDVGAVVVWIYWGGHLFAAIVHGLLGQPVMRVFRLRA
ncbi:MAG: cytochrome b/b6 domain-containing protein [Rhodanobacteraceae bacterium]